MTRKDYELIATALQTDAAHLYRSERRDYSQMTDMEKGMFNQWNTTTVLAVTDMLARGNQAFNRVKFLKACGVQSL